MPIDPKLITLTQWLSPAYPVGAFAYSHGLESAIAAGWVCDAPSLQGWLQDLVERGSGRVDASFVVRAAIEDPLALDAELRAFASSAERLRESARQGAAFAKVTRTVWALDLPDLLLPVALGAAAARISLEAETTAALYLHSFVSNLSAVAQRLMPLGQTQAQEIVHSLTPLCATVAAAVTQDATPWSVTWASDIAAMRHETLEPRLFQS